ncbi:uncharacterized protein LOC122851305 [Aphidius gifuensis]|uniref:uncharacterized protein LOC122851305 n=1 Tax=Aphidius gifuensis TaxID=684658 RepID=UPI001CDD456E|nr:uncharacterized protein LOC122851305 [Aphidius gifuensis]
MENRKEIDIKILDDDCLAEIFTHLPLKKRIEIEEVCQWWQAVGRNSWHDIKKLKFSKYQNSDMTQEDIEQILFRCGYFLKSLEIWDRCYSSILLSVQAYCPNLEKLVVQFDAWNGEQLASIFSNMKNLQHIKFDLGGRFNYLSTPYYFADELIKGISLINSLTHVEIDHHLNISGCKKVTNSGLEKLAKLEFLTNLRIKFLPHIKDTIFSEFRNLKNVSCVGCANVNDISIHKLLKSSRNLERLYLRETPITVNTLLFANGFTRYQDFFF